MSLLQGTNFVFWGRYHNIDLLFSDIETGLVASGASAARVFVIQCFFSLYYFKHLTSELKLRNA